VSVAALFDIHGNLPALEAVVRELRQARVDRVIVGGDLLPGPMPRETLTLLRDFDVPVQWIFGNGEVAVLEAMAGRAPAKVPEQFRPLIDWTARQLQAEDERLISGWPMTLRTEVRGLGEVLFCHATARNEDEIFTRSTSEDVLRPVFDPVGVPLVVCGHTHMQFDRMVGGTRVVNAGSVGMPFGEPGAYWLLLGPQVELRRTRYDLMAAADRIRGTSYPQAEEFAARYVLHPPTEQQMLDAFAKVEMRP
jgi:predicted phosphodiesterase